MKLSPAPIDTGIVFRRKINGSSVRIKANYNNVKSTKLCTLISDDKGNSISTVEHILRGVEKQIYRQNTFLTGNVSSQTMHSQPTNLQRAKSKTKKAENICIHSKPGKKQKAKAKSEHQKRKEKHLDPNR